MKKGLAASFVCILFLFYLSMSTATGEAYLGKDFPSDEILIKTLKTGQNEDVNKILGKYQDKDGFYHVYYLPKESPRIQSFRLIKLDTNVWVVLDFRGLVPFILQRR